MLVGVNYVTFFEAKEFELTNGKLPIREVMLLAYPDSKPDEAPIKQCSLEVMLEETNPCFSYNASFLSRDKADEKVVDNLRAGFWRGLGSCIDSENAIIYSYNSQIGLPKYDIIWQFAWLIHTAAQKKCVFVYGGSPD